MNSSAINRLSLAGLCANLVGNGIGRFAYIALMPALIGAGWFSPAHAAYLGVATLVGYLLGSPLADLLARRWSNSVLLRGAMLVCSLSFFACAIEGAPLPWYYFWRTVVGVCGALLMVVAAPTVLPRHLQRVRGRASGVVFSGIGLGAMLSGAFIPLLIAGWPVAVALDNPSPPWFNLQGLTGAWLGMGGVCLLLTWLAWGQWPNEPPHMPQTETAAPRVADAGIRLSVALILLAHGLNAVGYLAHTLFWVDYLVRELGLSLAEGAYYWAMFGLGAAVGPMVTGTLADWLGLRRCLVAGFVLKAFAAVLPVLHAGPAALLASSLLMGIFTPGIAALVSAYALDRVGPQHHRRVWGLATTSFAFAQAAAGAVMAFVATRLGSYEPLFCVSAVALLGSVACMALMPQARGPQIAIDVAEPTDLRPTPET